MSGHSNPVILPYDLVAKYSPDNGHAEVENSPHSLYFRTCPEVSQQIREFLQSRGWTDLSYAQLHPLDYPALLPSDLMDQIASLLKRGTAQQRMQFLKQCHRQLDREIKDFLSRQPIINGVKPELSFKRPIPIPRNPNYYQQVPPIWSLWWEDQGFNPINVPTLNATRGWNHIFTISSQFRKDGLQQSMRQYEQTAGDAFANTIPKGWVLPTDNIAWNQYLIKLLQANGYTVIIIDIPIADNNDVNKNNIDVNTVSNEQVAVDEKTIYVQYDAQSMINLYTTADCTTTRPIPDVVLHNHTWIAKPSGGARGEGIFVFNDLNKLNKKIATLAEKKKSFHQQATQTEFGKRTLSAQNQPGNRLFTGTLTVQEYMTDNMLIGNPRYKFDLRLYVLVVSHYPLEVYIHQLGVVRIASLPFEDDITKTGSHLTNFSVGKQVKPKAKAAAVAAATTTGVETAPSDTDTKTTSSSVDDDVNQNSDNNNIPENDNTTDDTSVDPTTVTGRTFRPTTAYDTLQCDNIDATKAYSNSLKWTLEEFEEYINKRKAECDEKGIPMYSFAQIWLQIKHCVLKALLPTVPTQCYAPKAGPFDPIPTPTVDPIQDNTTVWQAMMDQSLQTYRPNYRGYELLGVDIMLKNDGEPLLIEMNRSPAMTVQTPADYAKTQVLHDLFNMLNIEPSLLAAKRQQFSKEEFINASKTTKSIVTTLTTSENNNNNTADSNSTDDNSVVEDAETLALAKSKDNIANVVKQALANYRKPKTTATTTDEETTQESASSELQNTTEQKVQQEKEQSEEKKEDYHLDVSGVKLKFTMRNQSCIEWMKYRPEYQIVYRYLTKQNTPLLTERLATSRDEIGTVADNLVAKIALAKKETKENDPNRSAGQKSLQQIKLDFGICAAERLLTLNTTITPRLQKLQKNAKFQKRQKIAQQQQEQRIATTPSPSQTTTTSDSTKKTTEESTSVINSTLPEESTSQSQQQQQYPMPYPFCQPHNFQRIFPLNMCNYLSNSDEYRVILEDYFFTRMEELETLLAPHLASTIEELKQSDQYDIIIAAMQEYQIIAYSLQHINIVLERYYLKTTAQGMNVEQINSLHIDVLRNVDRNRLFDPTELFAKNLPSLTPQLVIENIYAKDKQNNKDHNIAELSRALATVDINTDYWLKQTTTPIAPELLENPVSLLDDVTEYSKMITDINNTPLPETCKPGEKVTSANFIVSKSFDMRISKSRHNINQYMYHIAKFLIWYYAYSNNKSTADVIPQPE